jgi:hypothetical protein
VQIDSLDSSFDKSEKNLRALMRAGTGFAVQWNIAILPGFTDWTGVGPPVALGGPNEY